MGKIADATFSGASGKKYSFGVYALDATFTNIGAVYVFTKRSVDSDGQGTHTLLYIGEAGELGDRLANHEKRPCVELNDGNCTCVHADENDDSRLDKETDLRHANDTPCNDQ